MIEVPILYTIFLALAKLGRDRAGNRTRAACAVFPSHGHGLCKDSSNQLQMSRLALVNRT